MSLVITKVFTRLWFTAPHANITSDTDSTTLLSDQSTQRGTFRKTRKLFGTEDGECRCLDLQAEVHVFLWTFVLSSQGIGARKRCIFILIFGILWLFIKTEIQPIQALMANRQVWEDEIATGRRSIQVGNASNWNTGQDRAGRWLALDSSVRHRTGPFEGGKQKEVGVVGEGDFCLLHVIVGVRFVDVHFDNGRRVDRTTVRRG